LKQIDRCPCCNGTDLDVLPAAIAPFIIDYVVHDPAHTLCGFCVCRACAFRFFDARFEPAEIARLYEDYRGDAYFQARHRHEFWYRRTTNDQVGSGPALVALRKRIMASLLVRVIDTNKVESILDYGGDRGQFLPDALGRSRWVYEVSGVLPVPGVRSIASEADLGGRYFDVVALSNVLEHAPDVLDMLLRVRALTTPGTGVVYLEVPDEHFDLRFASRGRAYRRTLGFLARNPSAFRWVDLYSALFRIKLRVIPPFGVLRAHEHINFFSEPSLRRLLARGGLTVLACVRNPAPYRAWLVVARADSG